MKEDQIPKFLRMLPNVKEKKQTGFSKLIDEYRKKFNSGPPTEPGGFTEEEWCIILIECIQKDKTVNELLQIEQNDEWDD